MGSREMILQTLQLEHIPQPHEVHVAAFRDVTNTSFLRDQLLTGNPDFEYAFVDAGAIVSMAHILAAVHQAVHKLLVAEKLRTRNVHSEIVFCLSPNNNITESFRRFGVSPSTTTLLCVKVSSPDKPISASEVKRHLGRVVEGTPIKFSDEAVARETDWAKVGKCYKIKTEGTSAITEGLELEILGKLVMRAVG